ncbi:YciI family protein [Arthrobacter sp. MMS24-S77]
MKKFVVLYNAPQSAESAMAESTPEAAAEGMKLWTDWATRAGDGIVDLGTPLGAGKIVGNSGVSDAETGVGGYSVLQAEDMDGALKLLEGHPHFLMAPEASIHVYEQLDIPGM